MHLYGTTILLLFYQLYDSENESTGLLLIGDTQLTLPRHTDDEAFNKLTDEAFNKLMCLENLDQKCLFLRGLIRDKRARFETNEKITVLRDIDDNEVLVGTMNATCRKLTRAQPQGTTVQELFSSMRTEIGPECRFSQFIVASIFDERPIAFLMKYNFLKEVRDWQMSEILTDGYKVFGFGSGNEEVAENLDQLIEATPVGLRMAKDQLQKALQVLVEKYSPCINSKFQGFVLKPGIGCEKLECELEESAKCLIS